MKIDLLTTIEERAGVRGEALPSIELPQMGGEPLRFLPEIKCLWQSAGNGVEPESNPWREPWDGY